MDRALGFVLFLWSLTAWGVLFLAWRYRRGHFNGWRRDWPWTSRFGIVHGDAWRHDDPVEFWGRMVFFAACTIAMGWVAMTVTMDYLAWR